MRKTYPASARIEELRGILAEYRRMTVEEVEDAGWGDVEIEIESELWRLEQELADTRDARLWRAA